MTTHPTHFLESPFPGILEAFEAGNPDFFETQASEFDYHLKADLVMAQRPDAILLGDACAHIDAHGDYVGVYPAFYLVDERVFCRVETLEWFESEQSVPDIRQQFGLVWQRPFDAMLSAIQRGDTRFFETTKEVYFDQLNSVPPVLYGPVSFLAGEAATHGAEGSRYVPFYSAFYSVSGRYFCRLESVATYGRRESVPLIHKQIGL